MIQVTYVNVFSYVVACECPAEYIPEISVCRVLDFAGNLDDVNDPDDLTDEYMELPDGTRLREEDGICFDWQPLDRKLAVYLDG